MLNVLKYGGIDPSKY